MELDGKETFLEMKLRCIGTRSGDAAWPGKGSASIRGQLVQIAQGFKFFKRGLHTNIRPNFRKGGMH